MAFAGLSTVIGYKKEKCLVKSGKDRAFFGDSAASRRGTRDFAFFCKTAFFA